MTRKVVVRLEARAELKEGAAWYRSKSRLVALAFRSAIREVVLRASERPSSFPEITSGVRLALSPQFPHAVFFAEEAGTIGEVKASSLARVGR